jgi:hypothetical protein
MHKTSGPEGQNGAHQGTVTEGVVVQEGSVEGQAQVTQLAQDGTNEQGSTPCGIEPCEKRVKGVEPSTFTLAKFARRQQNYPKHPWF